MTQPPRIILIDDDESIWEATNNLLRLAGFEIRSFSSVEELLEAPNLNETLILDLRSPSMKKLRTAIHDTIARGCSHQHHRR